MNLKTLLLCLFLAPVASLQAAPRPGAVPRDGVSYFSALANLASPIMFAGFGEPLVTSPYERDEWLRRAGYVTRPPMPEIAIVGPVYRAALPRFLEPPAFSDPGTLQWDPATFDRTLDPGAQAWTLIKITSPRFHLQFHDLPENRLAALMMIPQAREQARLLDRRLRNPDGLFAPRRPDGTFGAPRPADQAAALWGLSSLMLAATRPRDDYWHRAYRSLVDAGDYRAAAERALAAVRKLPPVTPPERAIAIEALGRYGLIATAPAMRATALGLAREQADRLSEGAGDTLEARGLTVYGLTEAGRLLGDDRYRQAAEREFRHLLGRWDPPSGLFLTGSASGPLVYTPRTVGALVAALNAMRWFGPGELARQAEEIHPRFLEAAMLRSGLLQASPRPLISDAYRENPTLTRFDSLPDPARSGFAPVFVSAVRREAGRWQVTDPRFHTADALFLANMLALRSGGEADTFLPDDLLPAPGGETR